MPSSTPPTFLRNQTASHTTKSLLRRFLHPLYTHFWLSTWTFSNLPVSPLHSYLLPPSLFHNSLVIKTESRFNRTFVSTTLHIQCDGHMVYIPLHTFQNYTVGYCIYFTSDSKHLPLPINRPPFSPPYIARFIYNHSSNHVMNIIPSFVHNLLTVLVFTPSTQYTFMLPLDHYSWDSVPNQTPIALRGPASCPSIPSNSDQLPFSPVDPDATDTVHLNNADLTPVDVQDLLEKFSANPHPTDLSSPNTLPDLPLLTRPQQQDICSQMLPLFHKRLYCTGLRIDPGKEPFPEQDQVTTVPNLHHMLELANEHIQASVSTHCSFVYYSITVGCPQDTPLLRRCEDHDLNERDLIQNMERELEKSRQTRNGLLERKRRIEIQNKQLRLLLGLDQDH